MRGPTKKIVWVAVLAVAAIGLNLVIATSSGAIDQPTTLTFVNHPVNETGIDVNGNQELDPADGWVSNSNLLQDDVVVGRLISSCQYIKVSPKGFKGVLQCEFTASFAEGQIAIQGRLDLGSDATSLTFAVTGGTGDYANVRGTVTGEPIEGSEDSTVTFTLVP
jgi:hypothetical protein